MSRRGVSHRHLLVITEADCVSEQETVFHSLEWSEHKTDHWLSSGFTEYVFRLGLESILFKLSIIVTLQYVNLTSNISSCLNHVVSYERTIK
jgi:hypothetical protein